MPSKRKFKQPHLTAKHFQVLESCSHAMKLLLNVYRTLKKLMDAKSFLSSFPETIGECSICGIWALKRVAI